jgi:hypothetical protein
MFALRTAAVVGMLLLAGPVTLASAASVSREYQLKAAFLFSFTKFTEWPANSLPSPTSPIVIGVLGRNPFGGELARIVRSRTVNGHPLVVASFVTVEQARQAHVVFLPGGDPQEIARAIAVLGPLPVLTVGESAGFLKAGGVVSMAVADDRVTFGIDVAAAERASLRISAQLQKLATVVTDHRRESSP